MKGGPQLTKTLTHEQMQEKESEAKRRKETLLTFCKNNNFTDFQGLSRILEVFYNKGISEYLDFHGFARFTGVEDTKENRFVFELLLGDK